MAPALMRLVLVALVAGAAAAEHKGAMRPPGRRALLQDDAGGIAEVLAPSPQDGEEIAATATPVIDTPADVTTADSTAAGEDSTTVIPPPPPPPPPSATGSAANVPPGYVQPRMFMMPDGSGYYMATPQGATMVRNSGNGVSMVSMGGTGGTGVAMVGSGTPGAYQGYYGTPALSRSGFEQAGDPYYDPYDPYGGRYGYGYMPPLSAIQPYNPAVQMLNAMVGRR